MDTFFDRHIKALPSCGKLPYDKIGHHYDKHMPSGPHGKTNVNRTQFQVSRLTIAKCLLHRGKVLITVMDSLFCCGFRGKIAFQDVAAVKL
jgi:hypothetical protein